MQVKLLVKGLVLLLLFLLLQVPLWWTRDVVDERAGFRDQAVTDVAHSQAGTQQLIGPILVVPFRRQWQERSVDADGKVVLRECSAEEQLTLLPENLQVNGNLQVETRQRGIFPVPVFRNTLTLTGKFIWPEYYGRQPRDGETLSWRQPYLALSVSGQRGIKQVAPLQWKKSEQRFLPGSKLGDLQDGQGLHAPVPLTVAGDQSEFHITLSLAGTRQFGVIPVGSQTDLQLQSNWPHPQFNGGQLPDERSVSDNGFTGHWQTSHLATNLGDNWARCRADADRCDNLWQQQLSVSLFEPVDIYSLSERALKYGFLFLGITFAAFFLLEMRLAIPVHPVQYGLVGLALGLFFLLLISLSEQIGFTAAYSIAAAACISLITFYLSAVLREKKTALGFAALLAALYAALYVILQLEDVALLIGALLLFVLLAVAMAVTRRFDWYDWRAPPVAG